MKAPVAASLLALSLAMGLSACEKKPETPMEKVEDGIKDGLNMRPNENMKDAGENLGDAAKDASQAVKDAAKEATDGK